MKMIGVMIDCSRNAVPKVSAVKKLIDALQKMGYNTLELYTEDTFEVEGEPYFGYLRGRYSSEEIKEIDKYARAHGIELIPCIQTLAHFSNSVKLPRFWNITDVNDILLIDEEQTYEFIEKLFATIAKNFTSRNVHIGMDEAHMVGLGKYLDRHGVCDRFEILNRHLNRVEKIAEKYGFNPHMWSDMFYRLAAHGEYYAHGVTVPQEVREKVPDSVQLVYWDYYHTDKEHYDAMITSHNTFGRELWFAGGAWTWKGFAPRTRFTYRTMKPAMQSVRENGVQNVLITMWGDNGNECPPFALLQALYAIRRYADGEYNEHKISDEFEKLFGVKSCDFDLLELPDIVPEKDDNGEKTMPSKLLLYSDPFMGMFDCAMSALPQIPYADYAKSLASAKKRAGEYAYLFDTAEKLCVLMEKKAYLGVRTREAYRKKDRASLEAVWKDYSETEKRLQDFCTAFEKQWHTVNKPQGYEVQCARLGGVKMRLEYCAQRIRNYLDGNCDKIEELEETILPLDPNRPNSLEPVSSMNAYIRTVSTSEL